MNHIAIISPVIGDTFNSGLVRISNLLDRNNIPNIHYYNELKEE